MEMPCSTSGQNAHLFFSTISAGLIKASSLPMESKNTPADEKPTTEKERRFIAWGGKTAPEQPAKC